MVASIKRISKVSSSDVDAMLEHQVFPLPVLAEPTRCRQLV
jgi:hypothetical protein